MNRDEVIRMAREAGGEDGWGLGNERADPELTPAEFVFAPEALERFAALVAASEREACAKICADGIKAHHYPMLSEVAAAIRARGETK